MKSRLELLPHSHYLRQIRPLLPPDAFAPAPGKLWIMAVHLIIITLAYVGFRYSMATWLWLTLSIIIGHSLGCLAFLSHELSHGVMIRGARLRYCLEVLFWGLNIIPATIWRRVHNQTHHVETNTLCDPDRRFRKSENSFSVRCYSRMFYPHRQAAWWNPLVAFQFIPYIVGNIFAAFCPRSFKLGLLHSTPSYTPIQRLCVAVELSVIITIQVGVFHLVGHRLLPYLWAGPVALLWMSAVVMTYVFTNHFLNPLGEITDPLAGSTSVVVWSTFDRLHSNFSYHTEHHLFPKMNSNFYPIISKLLQERFPGRYHRVSLGTAWRRLWAGEVYAPDPDG